MHRIEAIPPRAAQLVLTAGALSQTLMIPIKSKEKIYRSLLFKII